MIQRLLLLLPLLLGESEGLPPARGGDSLEGVTDQEIIRALSVLLSQERQERRPRQGVSFRTRDQFDEEDRKLMDEVESERQSLSKKLIISELNSEIAHEEIILI